MLPTSGFLEDQHVLRTLLGDIKQFGQALNPLNRIPVGVRRDQSRAQILSLAIELAVMLEFMSVTMLERGVAWLEFPEQIERIQRDRRQLLYLLERIRSKEVRGRT